VRLSVNVAVKGSYITAGTELPADFELPSHLEPFVIDETEESRRTLSPAAVEEDDRAVVKQRREVKLSPYAERQQPRKLKGLRG
jgi:hypothetical protein